MADKVRLTKRVIDKLPVPDSGEARVWDTEVTGFVLRVFPNGRRSFGLKYRVDNRQRWFTIGDFGDPWTVEEARERARAIMRDAKDGVDRQFVKEETRQALTVSELIERYLKEGPYAKPNKRLSSWANDASLFRRHVIPLLGKRLARDLLRKDVERMQSDILAGKTAVDERTKARGRAIVTGGPAVAAGAVRSLSAMMNWAMLQGLAATNPAQGVHKIKLAPRERFLTRTEAQAVLDASFELVRLRQIPATHASVIRLLLFTGARKSEIAELVWREVDLDRGLIRLPPHRSKTGEKVIPLNSAAIEELEQQDRETHFVFPSSRGDTPVVGLYRSWEKLRAGIGLQEVRIHDLRHSFASFAAEDGASLHMIGKALGHRQPSTTQRYAHLADDPVRAMAERVGQRFKRPAT